MPDSSRTDAFPQDFVWGVAAAAHLASATAAIDPEPGLATSLLIQDNVGPAHRVSKGRLWLSDTPGLGTGPFPIP